MNLNTFFHLRADSSRSGAGGAIGRILLIISSLALCGGERSLRAQNASHPWVNCEIHSDTSNVVLRWFGNEGAPYQIESSSAIGAAWTNHGAICAGNGAWMSVAVPKANENAGFFRVRDLSIAAESAGAVVAFFNPGSGLLTITGTSGDNQIVVSRDAAGKILVAQGAVQIKGGTPTVANTELISIFGLGGNDTLRIDEAGGAMPRAQMQGGAGNDVLTGGGGDDRLFGQSGFDTLFGRGGADVLFGGADNDTVTGGDGDDSIFLESGDDRSVWNPGDDTDLVEGGGGTDVAEVNGGNGPEEFATVANGERVRFSRIDPAPFELDLGTCEEVVLMANSGDDRFSATGDLATLIRITVDGGAGNDTILGSNGADLLLGGDGNDFVDGQQGNDVAFLGAGNDTFQWDPGDGSDTIEGQDGSDVLRFNGSGASEILEALAIGQRARLTRNVGTIVMDFDGVEQIDVAAAGGTDTMTINDLSGTKVVVANLFLAGAIGGSTGDGQADTVIVNGSNGDDVAEILGAGTSYSVVGLHALVSVRQSEGTNDSLVVRSFGGNDQLTASTLAAGVVKLSLDGGPGNDTLTGSAGVDLLLGGDNNDFIEGQQGNDTVFMGAGDDTFRWDPGEGNDTLEGQAGLDQLLFNGSNISENIDLSANGPRLRLFRNVANVTLDCGELEQVRCNALAGADNIVINDLAGTSVFSIHLQLSELGVGGVGDQQPDNVTVFGTGTNDIALVSGSTSDARVDGLTATLTIGGSEPANDRLIFNLLGGDDLLEASGLVAGFIQLTANGGSGA
ncbi:MAG TPA: calcium-binding protein, partial [Verrucomicrobiae bacterium]|nr:calcium-binding protein [Verrucomicrobiae bacterium]